MQKGNLQIDLAVKRGGHRQFQWWAGSQREPAQLAWSLRNQVQHFHTTATGNLELKDSLELGCLCLELFSPYFFPTVFNTFTASGNL